MKNFRKFAVKMSPEDLATYKRRFDDGSLETTEEVLAEYLSFLEKYESQAADTIRCLNEVRMSLPNDWDDFLQGLKDAEIET